MNFSSGKRLRPELNVTSLVDVVLNLLIFFMISTSFVVQPGLKVLLPKAATAPEEGERGRSVIITRDGEIYFERGLVALSELPELFLHQQSKDLLIIRADERTQHGLVVRVMDLARQSGFQRLAIATTPKKGGGNPP